jgi:aspartyl-tRNA(Asn)/glutamyl-tRNA(Gln) amidotransferase subunit C
MAAISREDVAHLAKLARINMNDAELDHLAQEMELILDAVARVQEVATIPVHNVVREDRVLPSLTAKEALSGAPAQSEDRFKVPQILGEE